MSRITHHLVSLMAISLLAGTVGCKEQQGEIDRLPDENAAREQQLNDLRAQLEAERAARARAEGDASRLASQNERLEAELAAARSEGDSGWQTVPGGALINIEGEVLFDSGSNQLKPSGTKTLDRIALEIRERFGDHDIYVFGHTDNEPIKVSGWKDNYQLSCERSLSVVRYLKSKGVSMHCAACGWGEHRPVASNSSAEGRQQNRRVQIFAYKP